MTENTAIIKIIDEITACRNITLEQLHMLLETDDMQAVDYLRKRASEKAHETYGNQVFIRGLIEFTNYCKNDCLYCGIRHSNTHADRYRLSTEQIMACCESGYELGFRTFVLQGGDMPLVCHAAHSAQHIAIKRTKYYKSTGPFLVRQPVCIHIFIKISMTVLCPKAASDCDIVYTYRKGTCPFYLFICKFSYFHQIVSSTILSLSPL